MNKETENIKQDPVNDYKIELQRKLDKHYQEMHQALARETKIGVRYDLRTRISEVEDVFNLLFK